MAEATLAIALGGREWTVMRARLGGFIRLQRARESLNKATKSADNRMIGEAIYAFLKVQLPDLTLKEFYSSPWFDVYETYVKIEALNVLPNSMEFSILRYGSGKGKPVPWNNSLRASLIWVHIIASAYGWSKNEIESLWPEEAVVFVQEILADQQQEKEFLHQLSEVAYEYNKQTKKSHYRPLRRPAWMTVRRKEQLIMKIRRDRLPVGKICSMTGTIDKELLN
jgi:hypothetical protein